MSLETHDRTAASFRKLRADCNDLLKDGYRIIDPFYRILAPISYTTHLVYGYVPLLPLKTLPKRMSEMFDDRVLVNQLALGDELVVLSRGADLPQARWVNIHQTSQLRYLRLYQDSADIYCLPGDSLYGNRAQETLMRDYRNNGEEVIAREVGPATIFDGLRYQNLIDQIKG